MVRRTTAPLTIVTTERRNIIMTGVTMRTGDTVTTIRPSTGIIPAAMTMTMIIMATGMIEWRCSLRCGAILLITARGLAS